MPVLRRRAVQPDIAAGDLDDNDLVEQSLRDLRAFAPLYERYAGLVYGYCFHRLGSRHAAEDATSSIFARALASLAGYRGPSFRAWLFGIAHHVVADAHRGRGPDEPLEDAAATIDAAPSPEDLAIASDDRRRLHALLTQLSAEQRRIVELRLAGLTSAEIGQVLGLRRGTVDVAQYRALGRLRAFLGITVEAKGECFGERH
jgi:RNA polymerase sigma-70 factor (ECF subfamily)